VVRGDEIGFPRDVALRDRLAQRQALELDTDPREVLEVFDRQWPDAEAALRCRLDEVLAGEAGYRFTDDAQAHAVLLREFVELQARGREAAAEQDLGA
jgi:hypothetical protein